MLAGGVRRVVRAEAKKAIRALNASWPPADGSIHEARKRIKKARAALRLLRESLGDHDFRRDNEAFRDAARPLSEMRDAKILIDALDALAARVSAPDQRALASLRTVLMARRKQARRRVAGSRKALQPVLDALRRARKRVETPRGPKGWSVVGESLRRVYRSGRRALATAIEEPTDENLHELRKQAKYLWHALQLLAPIRPATLARMAERAHELSSRLGADHDLALLGHRVATTRTFSRAAAKPILRSIERSRTRLQAQAMELGARVYAGTPKDFTERLGDYWRAWRSRSERR